jgi:tight adherence protein C
MLLGAILTVMHPVGVAVGILGTALGYGIPARSVARLARRRRARVVHELPDMIDLVVICTESGMALEPSIRLAAQRLPGPLSEELATTVRELDLGTPRRAAYAALASRMGVGELTGLVGALLQAEELGSPIADVLRRQAALLRSARAQQVREHAARAAPRVQLVIAMVMVPAALLVVLGLLAIQLIGQIGGIVGGTG